MCGIAGLLNLNSEPQTDPKLIQHMVRQLTHRGPDDEGTYIDGPVALGIRRLSIIDVDGGHQPLSNEDRSIWCTLNGEIYNYIELRQRLQSRGHEFSTRGDTETIVHAYEEYGLDFVQHLRGMFALSIWDSKHQRVILARDRIGKKPLFYSVNDMQLAFASELKALLPWPRLDKSLDYSALREYLRFLYIPAPRSIFAGVRKLLPGYILVAEVGSTEVALSRYWSFEIGLDHPRSVKEHVQHLRELIHESVGLRLRSDVPLGTLLSGGVDSSAVAALMIQQQDKANSPLSFSVGFDESEFDESRYAKLVAEYLGTNHHEVAAEPITQELLKKIVWHLDEPFGDSSALPTYLVCQAARQFVTVALSGDGGDELFAGYDRYRYFRWTTLLHSIPRPMRRFMQQELKRIRSLIGRMDPNLDDLIRRTGKALDIADLPKEMQPFAHNQYFDGEAINRIVQPDLQRSPTDSSLEDELLSSMPTAQSLHSLDWFLYIDTILGLPDDMLVKVDRMSMAVGLEVRCPLLDQSVVEYAGKIPHKLKLNGRESKYIFKRAIGDLLPKTILKRSKRGFSLPLHSWLNTTFRELILDNLSGETLRRRGIFDPHKIQTELGLQDSKNLVANPDISTHQRDHRIWGILMFELWAQQYLD